jgi:hypothetical protein
MLIQVPDIEDCESRMHALFKEEADLLQQRQHTDLAAWTTVLLADGQRRPDMAAPNVRDQLEVYRQRQQALAGPHQHMDAEVRRYPPDDDTLDQEDDTRLRQKRKAVIREVRVYTDWSYTYDASADLLYHFCHIVLPLSGTRADG